MRAYFEFPTKEDWKRVSNCSAYENIYSVLDGIESSKHQIDGWKAIEIQSWLYELRRRVEHVWISYFFMMFYYEKGIPDEPPKRNNGASAKYFPNFKEVDYSIKMWFDYFSDTLYYTLFSAWDLVGHILVVKYDLEMRNKRNKRKKKVSFSTALGELEGKDRNLYACLNRIKSSRVYKKAVQIRRDITHNKFPHTQYISVKRYNEYTEKLVLKKYTPSKKIVENVHGALELLAETLQCILK